MDDLTSALEDRWRELAPLQALALDPGGKVTVARGAPIGGLAGRGLWAFAGWDGRPEAQEDARFTRTPLDMSYSRFREDGTVVCSVIAQSGGDDLAAMASAADAAVNAIVADQVADFTYGGVVRSSVLQSAASTSLKNGQGVAVLVPFTVAYLAIV
jgi:hypothetical protein